MNMQVEITRMSSKGQIVIPKEMRKNIPEGEKLLILQEGDQLVIKKVQDLDKNFKEDIEFARRTEEAWKSYEKGEFIAMDADEFLKKLKTW
ncbi:MAG TPA: AbrB/MazE/SpoVT family DNA-binding domain-containing protein [Candidatus Nanoarchaeia archaeon]|nr:AbrB/MazE/SpoVT family DNA-binding domain-containing protein [Candidatus Nanoarchaeia archaeon]